MPNYNQPHQFYAGVDLHARSMFVHMRIATSRTLRTPDSCLVIQFMAAGYITATYTIPASTLNTHGSCNDP